MFEFLLDSSNFNNSWIKNIYVQKMSRHLYLYLPLAKLKCKFLVLVWKFNLLNEKRDENKNVQYFEFEKLKKFQCKIKINRK